MYLRARVARVLTALGVAGSAWMGAGSAATLSERPEGAGGESGKAPAALDWQPLLFEENRGQAGSKTGFVARQGGLRLEIQPAGTVLTLHSREAPARHPRRRRLRTEAFARPVRRTGGLFVSGTRPVGEPVAVVPAASPEPPDAPAPARAARVRMRLVGGNPGARLTPTGPRAARVHYLLGRDRSRWRTNVATYSRVRADDVYPGIDLVHYGAGGRAEYDFLVAPGADPAAIRMVFEGATSAAVDAAGDLVLRTSAGDLRHRRPVAYQEIHGRRIPVPCSYRLGLGTTKDTKDTKGEEGGRVPTLTPTSYSYSKSPSPTHPHTHASTHPHVSFEVGPFDKTRPLVIDPVLVYSTYFGKDDGRSAVGTRELPEDFIPSEIGVDGEGNSYLVGYGPLNGVFEVPLTPGSFDREANGGIDLYVAKVSEKGEVLFGTLIGGRGDEYVRNAKVDAAGNLYVCGETLSPDFPTSEGALQRELHGKKDPFVLKLSPDGSQLVYSTYLGGEEHTDSDQTEYAADLAFNDAGELIVIGPTDAQDFPITHRIVPAGTNITFDAFVVKLNPSGTSLVYSTLLGGNDWMDWPSAVALAPDGSPWITGIADSEDFPITPDALLKTHTNGFLTHLDVTARRIVYSTRVPGDGPYPDVQVFPWHVGVGPDGEPVVGFATKHADEEDAWAPRGGSSLDAFCQRILTARRRRQQVILRGALSSDYAYVGMSLDQFGQALLALSTATPRLPTRNPIQARLRGGTDLYVAKVRFEGETGGLAATADPLVYATYLGGSQDDPPDAVAFRGGIAHYSGWTSSPDFPRRGKQVSEGGTFGAFLSRISDGSGKLQLSTAARDFGRTPVGSKRTFDLIVRNAGGDPLSVSVGPLSPPFVVRSGGGSFGLRARSERRVRLEFAPTVKERFRATLTILSSAATNGVQKVTLTGTGS